MIIPACILKETYMFRYTPQVRGKGKGKEDERKDIPTDVLRCIYEKCAWSIHDADVNSRGLGAIRLVCKDARDASEDAMVSVERRGESPGRLLKNLAALRRACMEGSNYEYDPKYPHMISTYDAYDAYDVSDTYDACDSGATESMETESNDRIDRIGCITRLETLLGTLAVPTTWMSAGGSGSGR